MVGILQQGLQRTQSEDLVQHFQGKPLALPPAHGGLQIGHQFLDDRQRLRPGSLVPHRRYPLQIHLVQEVAMDGWTSTPDKA